jgi:hypothetical protein
MDGSFTLSDFAQKKERAEALPLSCIHFWFLNADFCGFSTNIAHLCLILVL